MKDGDTVICKWGELDIPTDGVIVATSTQVGPVGTSVTLHEVQTEYGRDWFEPHELIDCAEMNAVYDELADLRQDEADLLGDPDAKYRAWWR